VFRQKKIVHKKENMLFTSEWQQSKGNKHRIKTESKLKTSIAGTGRSANSEALS
jgi:hypothetical protein